MNEAQVTIDGLTRPLPEPFLVFATQNDTSTAGTFPLPEPQLDRFLLSIPMGLPDSETQLKILEQQEEKIAAPSVPALLQPADLTALRLQAARLPVSKNLRSYLLALCDRVRLTLGQPHLISARALISLQAAARATALLDGAETVHPDHLQTVFPHVLRHRLETPDSPDPTPTLLAALQETPVP